MWKKLQSLLFEEEEEIIEENDNFEEQNEVKKTKKSVIAQMNPELSSADDFKEDIVEDIEPLNDDLEEILEEVIEEPVQSKSFGISVDEPSVNKARHAKVETETVKKVYEFHPVISPMFGATESKHHDSEPRVISETHATLPHSVINTVISPIYGDLEVKKHSESYKDVLSEPFVDMIHDTVEESVVEKKHESNKAPEKVSETVVDTQLIVEEKAENEIKKSVYESMDLDDLLGAVKEEEVEESNPLNDEDAHQFSLFDEN